MGIRLGKYGRRILLSDIAMDELPCAFLETIFGSEGRAANTPGIRFAPIDNALMDRNGSSLSVALAFTLLYDSFEEVSADCFATPSIIPAGPQ